VEKLEKKTIPKVYKNLGLISQLDAAKQAAFARDFEQFFCKVIKGIHQ
jgi:hypothetical protein